MHLLYEKHKSFANKQKKYDKKVYYKYLKIQKMLKCNFSENNYEPDIDNNGNFRLKIVHCPLGGECNDENIICNSKLNTTLTTRELEHISLFISGMDNNKISDLLFVNSDTVKNIYIKIFKPFCKNGEDYI